MSAAKAGGFVSFFTWRDPGGLALAKAIRATLVAPALFAIFDLGFDSAATATIAAFGALASLIFADFGGTTAERIRAYLTLGVVGAVVLAAGTAVAGSTPVSVALTFVVVAVVRFAGNVGPRWKAAVSPLLLALTLGILVPVPGREIPGRVFGWTLSVLVATAAAVLILPGRPSERIDAVCARVARRVALALGTVLDPMSTPEARRVAAADMSDAKVALTGVAAMPLRPSGPGAPAVARRHVIQHLARMTRLVRDALSGPPIELSPELQELGAVAAATLDRSADVLDHRVGVTNLGSLIDQRAALRDRAVEVVEQQVAASENPDEILARVDAGFVARAGSAHADGVARNVAFVAGATDLAATGAAAYRVPDPGGIGRRGRVRHFVAVHAHAGSVWVRDALRAAIAVSLAVVVAQGFSVDHGFWVALGTVSVLRSSALSTGQTAVEASLGTAVGFVVSSAVFAAIGLEGVGLWVCFVVAVFAVGYLPALGGFVSGQAAFTVAVVTLFNIVDPVGWHTGLTRLEDVAIGAAVSAVVALAFWPRDLVGLVSRLVADVADAASSVLRAAVQGAEDDEFGARRRAFVSHDGRARVAVVELVEQHPAAATVTVPWISRLAIAEHASSAAESIVEIRTRIEGNAVGPTELTETVVRAAEQVAGALAAGVGPGNSPSVDELEASTGAAARAAIVAGSNHPNAVVRDLLVRDWVLTVAEMVDERP